MTDKNHDSRRRKLLTGVGAAGAAVLAGCTDGGGGETTTTTEETTDGGTDTTTTTTNGGGGSTPVKIGMPLPLSGELAFFGTNNVLGAKYMQGIINDNGGIGGRNVELVIEDTEADPNQALSVARQLINVEKVDALIGFAGPTVFQVTDLVIENQVPLFATTSAGDLVPIHGGYVWMTYPHDLTGGAAIALAASREEFNGIKSYEKMGILIAQGSLYSSFLGPLQDTFEANGGTVTETVQFTGGKGSYQSEVQRVVDSDPEIITVLATPSDSSKIMRAGFNAGYEGQWIGGEDASTPEFLETVPSQLSDGILSIRSTSPEYVDQQTFDDLAAKMAEAVDYQDTEAGIGTWLTYDAMTIIGLAGQRAVEAGKEVNRATISEGIRPIGTPPGEKVTDYLEGKPMVENGDDVDYEGVRSNCNFTENGNVNSPYNVFQVQDGSWETVGFIPSSEVSEYATE